MPGFLPPFNPSLESPSLCRVDELQQGVTEETGSAHLWLLGRFFFLAGTGVAPDGTITLCGKGFPAETKFYSDYGDQMVAALATLPSKHGAFLTNCPTHCETGVQFNNVARPGVTLGDAVKAWCGSIFVLCAFADLSPYSCLCGWDLPFCLSQRVLTQGLRLSTE